MSPSVYGSHSNSSAAWESSAVPPPVAASPTWPTSAASSPVPPSPTRSSPAGHPLTPASVTIRRATATTAPSQDCAFLSPALRRLDQPPHIPQCKCLGRSPPSHHVWQVIGYHRA